MRKPIDLGCRLPISLGCLALLVTLALFPPAAGAAGNHKLPTAPGVQYSVTQGNNQGPSHTGLAAWAFDLGLPQGSPVYASRAGYVAQIKVDSNTGGCDPSFNPFTNYIVIDHQDGTAGAYLHLQYQGTAVGLGQFVQQGQHIGWSGNTGYSCGPHLHFQVQTYIPGQYLTQSQPTIFADHNHPDDHGVPPTGRVVRARNYGLSAATAWYLAEGYTGTGFDEYLTLQNPNGSATTATVTYYVEGQGPTTRSVPLGANSRTTVIVHQPSSPTNPGGLGRLTVGHATKVEAPIPIIVERPMYFNYGAGNWDGGHDAVGATPHHDVGEYTWWFAEGWTGAGFDEYVTIQNPNGSAVSVELTYLFNGGTPLVRSYGVGANQRMTINVRNEVGSNQEVAIKLRASLPVIVERPMYFNYGAGNWDGGHNTPGAAHPEYTWYFAEGTTRTGFDQFFTVQNPGNAGPNNAGNAPANVQVTYYTATGGQFGPYPYTVPAKARLTISPRSAIGSNQDIAAVIRSDVPIVAERPMYFSYGAGGWKDGTVVVGLAKPEYTFYFAEGWTGSGFDEFLAIFNAHASSTANVQVQYIFPGGGSTVRTYSVSPRQRLTLYINSEVGANQEVSMKVTSTNNVPIVAERPMYFNYTGGSPAGWDGGHVVIGYSP
jgi:murein DD-endopeptidase MepM/ murein hydrolase activator NlpD